MSFEIQKAIFLENLLASEAVDSDGVHHEFNQGLHGRKIDFDKIPSDSDLFQLWVELVARSIEEFYPQPPDTLVGVASGSNRLVEPISERLRIHPTALKTEKKIRSQPMLTDVARRAIEIARPQFVLVVEDLGTRGTNALSVVRSVQAAGAQKVEVLNTLQRSPELELLRVNNISYRSILTHLLTTYTADECKSSGHCADGWRLIPYKI